MGFPGGLDGYCVALAVATVVILLFGIANWPLADPGPGLDLICHPAPEAPHGDD